MKEPLASTNWLGSYLRLMTVSWLQSLLLWLPLRAPDRATMLGVSLPQRGAPRLAPIPMLPTDLREFQAQPQKGLVALLPTHPPQHCGHRPFVVVRAASIASH